MEIALKVLNQVIVVFLLIGVGFTCTKLKMITQTGVKQMTGILLSVVTPCVLIRSYQDKISEIGLGLVGGLLKAALFTLLSMALTMLLARLIFRKEETNRYRIDKFASVYSNCGFMAIPLLNAALGPDGVFYGSAYLAVFTVLYWTVGVFTFTEDVKSLSFKNILVNPGVIGTIISILLFSFRIQLPDIIETPIEYLADINTPLAMIILGAYLVDFDIKTVLKEKGVYLVSLMRLLIFPLLSLAVAKLLQLDGVVAQAVMISSVCPTATVTTLFATRFNLDAAYSAQEVSVTTLLSVITIPLVMLVMGLVY